MFRSVVLIMLITLTASTHSDDKKVTVRFFGGEKKVQLEGLKVSIRSYTGDWSEDRRRKRLTEGTTDKNGSANFALSPGRYCVDVPLFLLVVASDRSFGGHEYSR